MVSLCVVAVVAVCVVGIAGGEDINVKMADRQGLAVGVAGGAVVAVDDC